MKTHLCLLFLVLALAVAAQAITVDGYALLSGRNDARLTKVLFLQRSPSAHSDSAYTDSTGFFTLALQPGIYDVRYSHTEFADYVLLNTVLLFDTRMDLVELMPPLYGHLSGTIGPGDFQVTDTMTVDSNVSLTIQHGTRLYFEPHRTLIVRGRLNALGQSGDSILFTRRFPLPDTSWAGINFLSTTDSSRMDYCIIEYGGQPSNYWGGGIRCDHSGLTVTHSAVRFNKASSGAGISIRNGGSDLPARLEACFITDNIGSDGAGVFCSSASMYIKECSIMRNGPVSSGHNGGGIYCYDSHVELDACAISDNRSQSGAGIWSYRSFLSVSRSTIERNTSTSYGVGGGVDIGGGSDPIFDHCLFSKNEAREGGAIYAIGDSVIVRNCTFIGNRANGGSTLYLSNYAELTSSVIAYGDTTTGMPYWVENTGAVLIISPAQVSIRYCNFFKNLAGSFDHGEYDSSGIPPGIGLVALTNSNNDSCDTYYNIFRDPMFVDTANGDYHLRAGSPCINAGDPSLPRDPDGSIADIGAFPYAPETEDHPVILPPSSFILEAFPNPFNPTTEIAFELPRAETVELKVFDIAGRLVNTLMNGRMEAGRHAVRFDGSGLPSGMYFCRIHAGEFVQTKKMVMIK